MLSINLAICWKLRVSRATRSVRHGQYSDNVTGADNQQERLDGYISGYVDGEGSFSVVVNRNSSCKRGYQLVPEFHVSQNGDRAQVLELIQQRLGGCGYIKRNGLRDRALVFVVRRRVDLLTKVIPFFECSPLLSSKQADFEKFAWIVRAMEIGHHRTPAGFMELLETAVSMNGNRAVPEISVARASGWSTRILRDCTPDRIDASGRYSPSCMATCRVRQK